MSNAAGSGGSGPCGVSRASSESSRESFLLPLRCLPSSCLPPPLPILDLAMTAEVAAASTSSQSSASMQRLAHPTAILPNAQAFRDAKVLVVGAGGIGCEVLKNLALVGVKGVQVVSERRGQ